MFLRNPEDKDTDRQAGRQKDRQTDGYRCVYVRKVLNLSNHPNPFSLPNVFDRIAMNEYCKSKKNLQPRFLQLPINHWKRCFPHSHPNLRICAFGDPTTSEDEQSLQFWEQESSKSTIAQLYKMVGGYFWGTSPAQLPQILSNPVERGCIGGFSEAGRGEWGF